MSGLVFKTGFARLGNVSVQPIVTKQEEQTIKTISLSGPTAQLSTKAPFASIVETMLDKNKSVLTGPTFTVSPTFRSIFPLPNQFDDRLKSRETGPDNKFSAYEELTGISRSRPEILFVTNFQPIFESQSNNASNTRDKRKDSNISGLNPLGEFLDAQIQLQHLRHEAMVKLIKDLKEDSDIAAQLDDKENDFKFHIRNLSNHVQVLYEVIDDLERLKQKLNIKNSPLLSYESITNRHFGAGIAGVMTDNRGFAERVPKSSTTPEFDTPSLNGMSFSKTLSLLGYDPKKILAFSSTKVFLQSLFELLGMLKGNSYNILGASTIQQRSDENSVYINVHSPQGFLFDPTKISGPKLETLINAKGDNALSIVNNLKSVFDALFLTANFTSAESRIAFLFNFLSKEYSFSRALSVSSTRKFISDTFGYTISDNISNEQLLDVVIGSFGNKITDKTDTFSKNSVSTIAQKIENDVSILPFEPDYIDFEQSTFTPGSIYFLDKTLEITNDGKFNLSKLDAFSKDLENTISRFTEIVRSFGMLPMKNQSFGTNKVAGGFSERMIHGRLIFEQVTQSFLNISNFQAFPDVIASDVLAIFTTADKDNYLKSLLFLYVVLKQYGSTSRSSIEAIDSVILEIDNRINNTRGSSAVATNTVFAPVTPMSTSRFTISSVSKNSMSSELKELRNTSNFLNLFFNNFANIFESFKSADTILNEKTRFGGVQDVILMMTIFEAQLAVVNTFIPKTLQGDFLSRTSSTVGQSFYKFQIAESNSSTTAKNSLSFNTIKGKINFEVDTIAKLIFTIVGSMTELNDSISSISKSMSFESKVKPINDILAVLGNRKLLSMILNPQQIFLIKSIVDDINTRFSSTTSFEKESSNVDFETRGPGRDDIALLDDSLISSKLKSALFSFFANEKFSSQKGHNIRLLSVGIPLGFSQKLRERVKLDKVSEKSFNPKQVDIIKVNVYKVDVEYQDIVFKPQSFLFELSRFVTKTNENMPDVSVGFSMKDVLSAFRTHDYSLQVPVVSSEKNGELTNLISEQYSFLTQEQKIEITQNHTISYILELYVRLLTGVSVSECDLYVDPSSVPNSSASPLIIQKAVEHVVFQAFQTRLKNGATDISEFRIQAPALSSIRSPVSKKSNVKFKVSEKPDLAHVTNLKAGSGVVETTKKSRTVFSDNLEESKRIFLPKAFDRVFNISVDPDDFEIDVEETLKTPSGKDAFDKLLKQNVIVGEQLQGEFYNSSGNTSVYKIRERDINENDLTFEKYFVTIDTVMDEVV